MTADPSAFCRQTCKQAARQCMSGDVGQRRTTHISRETRCRLAPIIRLNRRFPVRPGSSSTSSAPPATRSINALSIPARRAAAHVDRQWLDCTPPIVTTVVAPAARASASRNSSLRTCERCVGGTREGTRGAGIGSRVELAWGQKTDAGKGRGGDWAFFGGGMTAGNKGVQLPASSTAVRVIRMHAATPDALCCPTSPGPSCHPA